MNTIPDGYFRDSNGMLKQVDTSALVVKSEPIDPTDDIAVKAMVWDKLVAIASAMPPNASALPILRELLDRIEGKPMQRTQNLNAQVPVKNEIIVTFIGADD